MPIPIESLGLSTLEVWSGHIQRKKNKLLGNGAFLYPYNFFSLSLGSEFDLTFGLSNLTFIILVHVCLSVRLPFRRFLALYLSVRSKLIWISTHTHRDPKVEDRQSSEMTAPRRREKTRTQPARLTGSSIYFDYYCGISRRQIHQRHMMAELYDYVHALDLAVVYK